MRPPEHLETDRLRLRPPRMEDDESIFRQYAQDPSVTRYLTWRPHDSIDDTREYLERSLSSIESGSAYLWVITRREDGHLLGMIEARVDGHRVNLGYVLARAHWGRGYMAEAVRSLVEWALGQEGIYRVWAVCDVENHGSARVLEKAGMQREGVLRRNIIHPNISDEPRDSYCYSITK